MVFVTTPKYKVEEQKVELLEAAAPIINEWREVYAPLEEFTYKDQTLKFIDVVMSQVALETAYCSSQVYCENNNLVGMRHNTRGFSTGSTNGHATYKTKEDSLRDYIVWQNKYLPSWEKRHNKKVSTDQEYIEFLDAYGYAEDPNYGDKLENLLKTVKQVKKINDRA